MLFWYAGVATLLVYVTLGRSRVDYRMIVAGALAPGLLDALAHAFGAEVPDGRGVAHSFLAPVAVAVIVLVGTRGSMRLSLFGIAVGWLFHLVADAMWQYPRTFLWPGFGRDLVEAGHEPYSWDRFTDPSSHLLTWAKEAAGGTILVWFYVAFRLSDAGRRAAFLRDGRLRA